MADENTLTIIVKGGGEERTTATATPSKQSSPEVSQDGEGAKSALNGLVSYATAAAVADNIVSFEIGQVSLRTGATEYEQKLKFGYSIAKQGIAYGSIIAGGIMTGNPVIAAAAVAMSLLMKTIDIAQRSIDISTKKDYEDVSINLANVRAGTGGRRYGN